MEDGPRPVLPWEIPTEEQLASWKQSKMKADVSPAPFEFEWTLSHALGFFLFSAYLDLILRLTQEIHFVNVYLIDYNNLFARK